MPEVEPKKQKVFAKWGKGSRTVNKPLESIQATSIPIKKPRKPKAAEPIDANDEGKRGRKYTKAQTQARRRLVGRLYYVELVSKEDILRRLHKAGHNIRSSQLHNDIGRIKAEFVDAKKNGEGNLDEIISQIKSGHAERVQRLWDDFRKVCLEEKTATDIQDTKVLPFIRAEKRQIYKELRGHDDSFIANLSKLGITSEVGSDNEEDVLAIVRLRRKKREEIPDNIINPGNSDEHSK